MCGTNWLATTKWWKTDDSLLLFITDYTIQLHCPVSCLEPQKTNQESYVTCLSVCLNINILAKDGPCKTTSNEMIKELKLDFDAGLLYKTGLK